MKKIATVTFNPAVDITTQAVRVLPEKKVRCASPRREPGGGGINVSRAIQRLGGTSTSIYLAGGPTSKILEQALDAEGLTRLGVPTRQWTRENLHVFEQSTGQEYRFNMPGGGVTEEEWKLCLEKLASIDPSPDYIVSSGSLPPGVPTDVYVQLARQAAKLGARLVVDTSGDALRKVLLESAYLIKPNLREFQDLVGRELADEVEQEKAARELLEESHCEVIVLSLGTAGAWLITKDISEHIRSPSVPIRSRVGAGDSMVGGIVLALARGLDLHRAVRFGVASGAAAVMTDGTELCNREDAERIFHQMESAAE